MIDRLKWSTGHYKSIHIDWQKTRTNMHGKDRASSSSSRSMPVYSVYGVRAHAFMEKIIGRKVAPLYDNLEIEN